MSSGEEESDTNLNHNRRKKRRMRACDMCRRRKVRCDGGQMPNNVCSNCITFKYKCTYVQAASKRTPDAGYLASLETQMSEMRALLNKYRQLFPDIDLSEDPHPISATSSPFPEQSSATCSPGPSAPLNQLPMVGRSMVISPTSSVDVKEEDLSDDEVLFRRALAKSFDDLSINPEHEHYLGKSSSLMFLHTALDVKQEYVGGSRPSTNNALPEEDGPMSDEDAGQIGGKGKQREDLDRYAGSIKVLRPFQTMRPEFWSEHEWVREAMSEQPVYTYPPRDLIDSLVSAYFTEYNDFTPLLHRPSFERMVREQLYLQDSGFGAVLLMVCALGARMSDDPRVLLEAEREANQNGRQGLGSRGRDQAQSTYHSAGWEYFSQVRRSRLFLSFITPRVYDLQLAFLAAIYIWGTADSEMSWHCVGSGLRLAQTMGAHRMKAYGPKPTAEDELRKRAFWSLVFLDRIHSSVLGRPCTLQDEDFDVDLPVACDDEYWECEDPDLAFQQPEGKPSRVEFFHYLLRLTQIHAFALRTIYSINKTKASLGLVGNEWQQRIVAEIDSALNRWIDSIPDYLRWDPHMEDSRFLSQSALLYASYYTVQITVHRPFIPSPRKPSVVSLPSLAICTNAARSCIHIVDAEWRRGGSTSHLNQFALFTASIVLLLNIWGGKRSGSSTDPMKEMQEVHKAMNIAKAFEPRWYSAGRIWDILYDLANVGDLPLPQQPPPSQKRSRWDGSEESPGPAQQRSGANSPSSERSFAGSRRVEQYQQQRSPLSSSCTAPDVSSFSLPIYSQELSSLPIHPSTEGPTAQNNIAGGPHHAHNPYSTDSVSQPVPATSMTVSDQIPIDQSMPPPINSALEAWITMFAPTQYQQPPPYQHSPFTHDAPHEMQQPTSPFAGNVQSSNAPLSPQIPSRPCPTAVSRMPQRQAEPFDSDTLAMWSTAPSSFAWEDWGTYLTTFNQAGAPTGQFQGQQQS